MSLLALRRRLAVQPELCRPSWSGSHIDSTVRRSLLLAGWNEIREGDRRIVERFTGYPYDQATEALHTLDPGDAPMILTDEEWHVVSPADAWTLLSDHLTTDDLMAFGEVAHEVLTEPDPFHDMSDSERMRAQYEGVEATFSHQLRRGVATTLALLGSTPPTASRRLGPGRERGGRHRASHPASRQRRPEPEALGRGGSGTAAAGRGSPVGGAARSADLHLGVPRLRDGDVR